MSVVIQRTIILPDPEVHRFTGADDWHRHWASYGGIYAFFVGSECVYVGKSANVGQRVAQHLWSPDSDGGHREMHERIRAELAVGRLEVQCYRCENPDDAEGDVILAFLPTMNGSMTVGHGGCTVTASNLPVLDRVIVRNVFSRDSARLMERTVAASPSAQRGLRNNIAPLAADEVDLLLDQCSVKARTGHRNRALISVLWNGGARLNQILSLRHGDIDGDRLLITLKSGKLRRIQIDPTSTALIATWIAIREKSGLTNDQPLFCTLKGERVKTAYIRALLTRIALKAGLGRRVNAESLRAHTRKAYAR